MKYLGFFLVAFVTLSACSSDASKPEEAVVETVETSEDALQLVADSTKVNWTAYKTTEKVAVGGTFKEAKITNLQEGTTPQEVLNGASLSIPMVSVFTNNEERDGKLRTFFFEKLLGDGTIDATMTFEGEEAFINLNLNKVAQQFPVEYTFENNVFTVNTTIELAEYKALDALASLNEACYNLHMAADGVSKTWEDVAITGSVLFK